MQRFLHATAHGDAGEQLLERCLSQLDTIPPGVNVGFLYVTDALAESLAALLIRLKTHTPDIEWVGCVGMGICSTGCEFYDEPAMVMLLGSFPEGSYRVLPNLSHGLYGLDEQTRRWWNNEQAQFAILHAEPSERNLGPELGRLAKEADTTFFNGGVSSASSGRTVQVAGGVLSGGLSGIVFDERVEVLTDHTQGCSPIGPVHNLSEARRNVAIRIDGRPAGDVLKEEIGEVLSRNLAQSAGYIFAALPLRGSDTGDYMVRNLLGVDEDNGLVAVGEYLDGCHQIMFCRRDGNSARDDMYRMLERLNGRLEGRTIRGGLYISCLGRGRYQFGEDSEELKMISEVLGEFPLAGFFANGEIYNANLYGYTGVLTLFV